MERYQSTVRWARGDAAFVDNRYSRAHTWHFDGGTVVPASSSPSVVPLPLSVVEAVDPEEAFVASLASCHMLWFLSLAAKAGLVVDGYEDDALGFMEKNARGRLAITRVVLRPHVRFAGPPPEPERVDGLHRRAHDACFIAASVTSEIVIEPRF